MRENTTRNKKNKFDGFASRMTVSEPSKANTLPEIIQDGETYLNIYAKRKNNYMLVPKDYTVAYEQFYISGHVKSKRNKNYMK